jgi:hypothetical protein
VLFAHTHRRANSVNRKTADEKKRILLIGEKPDLQQERLAMPGKAPVVAAISALAKQTLVKAVKEKTASFVVLPVKPQTIRETLRSLELSENAALTGAARFLQPREKEPAQDH